MRKAMIGAAISAALLAPAVAGTRAFPTSDRPAIADVYPDRVTRWPGGVTSLADVVYSSPTGYRPLIVDIYMPPKAAKPRPLILYIHGGGWVGGHTRQSGALSNFPAVLASLASEGFVVASLEYRLSGEAKFPAPLQDARAALRFLKANAAKYGIDVARTGIWGGSAGGHLTALTALSCGESSYDSKPEPTGSECAQAAVTWYGVFDFAPMIAKPGGDGNAAALLGCTGACDAEAIRSVSPITHIDEKDPPFLLIHGEEDKVVAAAQSHMAEAAFKAAGVPVETMYIKDVDHSFIGATPSATRRATLAAVNATFDFFHRKLGVAAK